MVNAGGVLVFVTSALALDRFVPTYHDEQGERRALDRPTPTWSQESKTHRRGQIVVLNPREEYHARVIAPLFPNCVSPSKENEARARRAAKFALDAYPEALVAQFFDELVLLEADKTNDCGYILHDSIILNVARHFTDLDIVMTCHHEFMHRIIVEIGPEFPFDAWRQENPPDFEYFGTGPSGHAAVKNWLRGRFGAALDSLHKHDASFIDEARTLGFVNVHAMTTPGDDICELSAFALSAPNSLSEITSKYPRIARKYRLWYDYMRSIDPSIVGDK